MHFLDNMYLPFLRENEKWNAFLVSVQTVHRLLVCRTNMYVGS